MAKQKQIFIDVVVDDKGTTQRSKSTLDQLEKALIKTGKQQKNTQAQMRGAKSNCTILLKTLAR